MTFAALKSLVVCRILTDAQISEWERDSKVSNSCNQAFSSFGDHVLLNLKEKKAYYTDEACLVNFSNMVAYVSYLAI